MRLLDVLRNVNAIPAKPPSVLSACEQIVADFRQHLSHERGLAHVSIIRGEPVVRQFLKEVCRSQPCQLVKLTRTDILAFVERHVRDHNPRSAQLMCSARHSFIRYLQYKGTIDEDLTSAIPSIRRWKLTSLPTYLPPAQVEEVLRACDRRTATGRRDYAINPLPTGVAVEAGHRDPTSRRFRDTGRLCYRMEAPFQLPIHFDGWYQYAIWCGSLLKLGSWLVFSPPNIHTTPVSRHSLPSLLPHASTHPRKPASFGPMVIEGRLPVREFPTFRITL